MELSLFQPYSSKAPHHEDHLTWAYLNLLKLIPMALGAFLDMVSAQQRKLTQAKEAQSLDEDLQVIPPLSQLYYSSLTIKTQVTQISQSTGNVLSVVMTDERWEPSMPVEASDRGARFDGLLCFDPGWVLVIENKPRVHNIWEKQLHPPLPPGSELEISPGAICLLWKEIIQDLGGLVQRGLCQGIEAQLIEDFLAYVDCHYPHLNPYTSLGLCKGNAYLVERRCSALLESLGLGEILHNRGFKDYVRLPSRAAERMFLYPDESGNLFLELYPADTVRQAREFFTRVDKDAFLGLIKQGWSLAPNLHFSFMAKHLHRSNTQISSEAYFDYWLQNPSDYGQVSKTDLPDRLSAFVTEGLMASSDVVELDRVLMHTERTKANIIPGWRVTYRLPLAEAVALDENGQLLAELRRRLLQVVSTWEQPTGVIPRG